MSHLFCFNLSLAITPGGGVVWSRGGVCFMALVGYGYWRGEEVELQISDSHLKLSVLPWGPSGVSQRGHLGLVDVRDRDTQTQRFVCAGTAANKQRRSRHLLFTQTDARAHTILATQTVKMSLCTLPTSRTHTRLLSLSETQLIFWYRRGRPMCVHMDYCRLLPCLLTPLRSTQSLMLGDLFSIPVSSRLSCGHDNQIKMTVTHSLMTW